MDGYVLSFEIKDIKIFNSTFIEWRKLNDDNPVSFIAIRPELEGYVWHSFEFGMFVENEWITAFTPPLELLEGYYFIHIFNSSNNETVFKLIKDGIFISEFRINKILNRNDVYPFLSLDKRNINSISCIKINNENLKYLTDSVESSVAVFVATEDHLDYVKSSFASLKTNANWKGDIALIVDKEIDEDKLMPFRQKNAFILKSEVEAHSVLGNKSSDCMLLKLKLFSVFFKRWKKVLYLDLDVVIRGELNDLLYIDDFSAIPSPVPIINKIEKECVEKVKVFEENESLLRKESFCAAIMCFDTKIIEETIVDRISHLKRMYAPFSRLGDEPILNLVFPEWKEITKFYSGSSFFYDNIVSYHARKPKPWKKYSRFYKEWKKSLEDFEGI